MHTDDEPTPFASLAPMAEYTTAPPVVEEDDVGVVGLSTEPQADAAITSRQRQSFFILISGLSKSRSRYRREGRRTLVLTNLGIWSSGHLDIAGLRPVRISDHPIFPTARSAAMSR